MYRDHLVDPPANVDASRALRTLSWDVFPVPAEDAELGRQLFIPGPRALEQWHLDGVVRLPTPRLRRRMYVGPGQANPCFEVVDLAHALSRWTLVLHDPVTAVYVLRQFADLTTEEIVVELSARMIAFTLLLLSTRVPEHPAGLAPPTVSLQPAHPVPADGVIGGAQYQQYREQMTVFFGDERRRRAARQYGGLIARIASEYMPAGLEASSLEGPGDHCAHQAGGVLRQWQGGVALYEEVLSAAELDYVCGVYMIRSPHSKLFV